MPYYFFIYFHLIIHIECCSYVAEILCMGFVPVFNRFLASLFDAIENVGIQFEAQKLAQKKNRRENNWAFLLSLGIVLSIVYLMLWQHPRRTTMCVCVCFCLHVISSVNNMWCSALTWFTFIMQAKKEKKMYASHMWANCDPRTRSVSHVKIYSTRVNWFKYRNSYNFSVLALFFPQIKWFVLWKVKMPFKNVRDVFKKSLRSISNWWNHFGISPEIGDLLNCSAFIVFRRPSKIPIGLEAFRFPIKFL